MSSNSLESLHVRNFSDHVVGISREEDNFLRYFLQAHLAVDAVRIWFDTIVPPRKLEKHLKRHKRKAFKNCSDEQKGILFPGKELILDLATYNRFLVNQWTNLYYSFVETKANAAIGQISVTFVHVHRQIYTCLLYRKARL